ncbi:hypothetical protein E4H12_05465 [Candidatus Thorarchaeota archaeon]|nr:MAG: hypothetical protein E4H12_05465 [Candidatus Thorarchaeota archaeon]
MNGKMAKMLRKFGRTDHKSKKLFKSLDWKTRAKIHVLHKENAKRKLDVVDFLRDVTGVSKANVSIS